MNTTRNTTILLTLLATGFFLICPLQSGAAAGEILAVVGDSKPLADLLIPLVGESHSYELRGKHRKVTFTRICGSAQISAASDFEAEELHINLVEGGSKVMLSLPKLKSVKALIIGKVTGGSEIDCEALEAQRVGVYILEHGSKVKLRSSGPVLVMEAIEGGCTLAITAGSDIVFDKKIDGGATVRLETAGSVTIGGTVSGGSRLSVESCRDLTLRGLVTAGGRVDGQYSGKAECSAGVGGEVNLKQRR